MAKFSCLLEWKDLSHKLYCKEKLNLFGIIIIRKKGRNANT